MASQLNPLSGYQQVIEANQLGNQKNLSGHDKLLIQENSLLPWAMTEKCDIDHIDTTNMIWVPGAKHPQIAPIEFLEWIKTQGGPNPGNKNPVKRQRSTLSIAYTSSEEDDDADEDDDDDYSYHDYINPGLDDGDHLSTTCMNPVDPIDPVVTNDTNLLEGQFNVERRHLPIPLDASTVLARPEKPVLSRRKALSSRGQHISRQPASIKRAFARKLSDKSNLTYDNSSGSNDMTIVSSDGVQLYDQPTGINNSVDLDDVVQISCQQVRHQMPIAETHALTPQISVFETPSTSVTSSKTVGDELLRRSVSNRLSWTPNTHKKKYSWIRGLFGKHTAADDESNSNPPISTSATTLTPVLSTQVYPEDVPSSMPSLSTSIRLRSSAIPLPSVSRSSSLNLISYLSRKLSTSSTPSSSSKPEKHVCPPRRRFSNFLLHGKNFKKNRLVAPMESNCVANEQRLPLTMERGVYRLSHIKLANHRRPLREQVIISNFMFSIIDMYPHQIQQQRQQQQQSDNHDNWTANHQYAKSLLPLALSSPAAAASPPVSCAETETSQLEKSSSSITHPVHMPSERSPTNNTKVMNAIPATPVSSFALKNKKDKYKPIKNTHFGEQTPNYTPSCSSF